MIDKDTAVDDDVAKDDGMQHTVDKKRKRPRPGAIAHEQIPQRRYREEGTQYLMLPRQHIVQCDVERWKPEDFAAMLLEMQPFMEDVWMMPPALMNALSMLSTSDIDCTTMPAIIDGAFKCVVDMTYKMATMYWLSVHFERHREKDMTRWIMKFGADYRQAVIDYKEAYRNMVKTTDQIGKLVGKSSSAVDRLNCAACQSSLKRLRELVAARMAATVEQVNSEGMMLDNDRITL